MNKLYNVSVLLYQFVLPTKDRRVVFGDEADNSLKEICLEISKRYQIYFLEIETGKNHVHFLLQSVPTYSPTKIVTILKSLTAIEIFKKHPDVQNELWGEEFWSDGYFVNTVGKFGDEETIRKYVKEQGIEKEYKVLHKAKQLTLF